MPSFDVVSEVDKHELSNAVDQANREVGQRFDFKGSKARVERDEYKLTIIADGEFQAKQLLEILQTRLAKRGIDIDCLEVGDFASNIAETCVCSAALSSGRQTSNSRITRVRSVGFQASCSMVSSKAQAWPSTHGRVSLPTRKRHPGGTTSGRWTMSRVLTKPWCGGM